MASKSDETTDVPYALPKYGKLRGKRVLLAEAEARLSKDDLGQVEAMVGGNLIRPWRFASSGDEIRIKNNRVIV